MVYHKQHLEFKEWLSKTTCNGKLSIIQKLPQFNLCILEKEVFEIQEFDVQGFFIMFLASLHWSCTTFTGTACPRAR